MGFRSCKFIIANSHKKRRYICLKKLLDQKSNNFKKRKLTQDELAESLDESGKKDLDNYKNHM